MSAFYGVLKLAFRGTVCAVRNLGLAHLSDVTQGSQYFCYDLLPNYCALDNFRSICSAIMSSQKSDSESSYQSDDSDVNFIRGYVIEDAGINEKYKNLDQYSSGDDSCTGFAYAE